jgi:hypothetical protein
MEDSRLGLAILSDLCIQLWEKANIYVGAGWMLQKTIEGQAPPAEATELFEWTEDQ